MALLTNPMTADLQSRIQNSSFGSPDYLNGFQGTMPAWQQNMLMQTYTPGETGLLGGGNSSVPDYTGYTPGGFTPPSLQAPNPLAGLQGSINQFLPQMGGGGGDADPNRQGDAFSGRYESFGGKMFSFDKNDKPTEVIGNKFTSPMISLFAGLSGTVPGEEQKRFNELTDSQKMAIGEVFGNNQGSFVNIPEKRPEQPTTPPVINKPRPRTGGGDGPNTGGSKKGDSPGFGNNRDFGGGGVDRPGASDASNW